MVVVFILHDTIFLPIAVAAMVAVMLFELLRAVKLEKCLTILAAVELCGIVMPFIYERYYYTDDDMAVIGSGSLVFKDANVSLQAFCVMLLASFIIFVTWLRKHKEIRYEQVFFALASMALVPQAMSTMVRIDRYSPDHGLFLLIMGLCGAWIADTGAYFTGVAIGKHKLCPEISPKKTIEGFVGGIVTTGIVYAAAFAIYNRNTDMTDLNFGGFVLIFFIGAACAVIGTIGDLSASMVKRQIGFKDYGKIMPGHGGLMDRFDSVLFVLPSFYVLVVMTGII